MDEGGSLVGTGPSQRMCLGVSTASAPPTSVTLLAPSLDNIYIDIDIYVRVSGEGTIYQGGNRLCS